MSQFSTANTAVFSRLKARLDRLAHVDATPLMMSWQEIIRQDNLEGVLAGTDKDGMPLYPVAYRPVGEALKPTAAQRLGQRANRKHDLQFAGSGMWASGLNNNLTSSEYRRLGGPPLAPRGQFSRVISNLLTGFVREAENRWVAIGYWEDVVDEEGRPFLRNHFDGLQLVNGKRLPPRDLRGVRPVGRERARLAMRAWMVDVVQSTRTA